VKLVLVVLVKLVVLVMLVKLVVICVCSVSLFVCDIKLNYNPDSNLIFKINYSKKTGESKLRKNK